MSTVVWKSVFFPRSMSFLLGALVFSSPLVFGSSPAGDHSPTDLQCEALREPLGIDVTLPRLSWLPQDDRRSARQTGYEILVADALEKLSHDQANVWDSGHVESSESINVLYRGPAMESRRRYYWKVRVWDQDGIASTYSKPSFWEIGLLSASDWKAQWITRDFGIDRGQYDADAKYIWTGDEDGLQHARPGKRVFRFQFALSAKPAKSTLLIAAKDHMSVWINERVVLDAGRSAELHLPRDHWSYSRILPVDTLLVAGVNTIAVEVVVDNPSAADEQNPAWLLANIRAQMPDGKIEKVASGSHWKTAREQPDASWIANVFDDSSWRNAVSIATVGSESLETPWPAEPASLLRRKFEIAKTVQSARIYSTALGSYQLYLNGQRVGRDILAPGWTDYNKRIVYQTYDVTSLLRKKANAIGAILGGGWYADGIGWRQTRYSFGPPPTRLLVQLEIEYSDGTRDSIVSDESWRGAQSAILFSEIYNGETYDANLEQKNWPEPAYQDSVWKKVVVEPAPPAQLVAQNFEPIRETQTLAPKTVANPQLGVYIFDFGQNMVGWARLRVSGNKGDKVRLRFGEVLKPNGELYTENLRSAAATDTYVLRGAGPEVFEPHFTFHGFRYVELRGFPGVPSKEALLGIVFHTDTPFAMKFQTGNEMVNQLWSNILWGQRSNFLSVPTDCPQRDERLGWMGDAQIFWRAAAFNTDLAAFSRKFAADMRDAQSADGAYSDVAPRAGPTSDSTAGWGDAGIIIPWTAYTQYRDVRIIEENWAAMERWMRYLESANPNYLWLKKRNKDYGDWLAIGSETSKDLIATAYWAYDASLMRSMALATGRKNDADQYEILFRKIEVAFNEKYVKADATVGNGSQTSYVLALHMQLLPESLRAAAAEKLVADIKAHDWHLTTGFLGTPYLLLELSASGHSDTAYKLLFQNTYPSWSYMIERGATTMWERWNSDQMLDHPDMNSFNHYAYGSVAEWLYRYVAGIDFDAADPGFHHIVLHPQLDARLGSVKASYNSQSGAIISNWKIEGTTTTWSVVIPPNTTALLHFPRSAGPQIFEGGKEIQESAGVKFVKQEGRDSLYEAESGAYSFSFRTTP